MPEVNKIYLLFRNSETIQVKLKLTLTDLSLLDMIFCDFLISKTNLCIVEEPCA